MSGASSPPTRGASSSSAVDLIRQGGTAFDRATFDPGWRFTEHDGQSGSCQERHLGYLISGRKRFRMEDGTEVDAAAGVVYLITRA